jgi:hypothetical protein
MLSTLSADESFGIMLVLAAITIFLAPRRCLSCFYTVLACYHGLIALLARTEVFIFFIFLSLLVEDICQTIVRAIKLLVLVKFGLSGKFVAQPSPNSATYATNPQLAPVNYQLLAWIKEDAEEFWKAKADAREQEAQRSQEKRATYRELASLMPERELPDFSEFEMEARGCIAL